MKCTVCNGEGIKEDRTTESTLWRCPRCTHCYSELHKEPEKYSSEYFLEKHKNWFENPMYTYYASLYSVIMTKQYIKVLDVGCGQGQFLKYLNRRNNKLNLTGLDLIQNTHPQIKFIQKDILNTQLHQKYDIITNFAVIEHIKDVQTFTRKLAENTSKGGKIIIMTVNEEALVYKIARILHKFGINTAYERLYEKHHVNHFTKESLKQLLEKEGIVIIKQFTHNPPLKSVDFPLQGVVFTLIQKTALAMIYAISKITKKEFLQTVIGMKSC